MEQDRFELNKSNKDSALDLLELTMKYGDAAINKYVSTQSSKIVENYLKTLTEANAYELLSQNSAELKKVIGENNFNALLAKYKK